MQEKFDFYTPLEEAKKEIWKRWNDGDLEKKVNAFLNMDMPEVIKNQPKLLIVHNIASPDIEFTRFIDFSIKCGLKPLCYEYLDDLFCSTNPSKVNLVKLRIFDRFDKKTNKKIFKTRKVVDLENGNLENKKFSDITTLWGENLVDFHHRILKTRFPDIELFDASPIFNAMGKKAYKYYSKYLALFIRNGILFENFIKDGKEGRFTERIVEPAFKEIEEYFGIKPLIVEGVPSEEVNDKIWSSHPKYMDELIK